MHRNPDHGNRRDGHPRAASLNQRHIRLRTCVATREKKQDTDLLRVVMHPRTPGVLLPDPSRSMPGRGAWLTPTLSALELAEQRRAFGRAFRVSTPVDTGHVHTYLVARDDLVAGPQKL